jgi:hypothetical protein
MRKEGRTAKGGNALRGSTAAAMMCRYQVAVVLWCCAVSLSASAIRRCREKREVGGHGQATALEKLGATVADRVPTIHMIP